MGVPLPNALWVVEVEPCFEFTETLSPAVEIVLEKLHQEVQ